MFLPALVCATTFATPPSSSQTIGVDRLTIVGATVFDGTGRPARAGLTIVISGDTIEYVGAKESPPLSLPPRNRRIIDGRGLFVIPGLWDMHVHRAADRAYTAPLLLAHGITSVRDMHAVPSAIERSLTSGKGPSPRVVAWGAIVDGPRPYWFGSQTVADTAEARRAVRAVRAAGADFVKVYDGLSLESYRALMDEARLRRVVVAGHVPVRVRADEAARLGQKSIEHLFGVLEGCSTIEDEWIAEIDRVPIGDHEAVATWYLANVPRLLRTQDEAKATFLFAEFVRHGTWHVPTLGALRAAMPGGDVLGKAISPYLPRSRGTAGAGGSDPRIRTRTPAEAAAERAAYSRCVTLVGAMHRAGVRMLAGSDCGALPSLVPGASLHRELELLVGAGIPAADVLRFATRDAAEFSGLLDRSGTIEAGKRADLVLLEGDPLQDIHAVSRIAGVIAGGRHWTRADLDALLLQARTEAERR